MGKKEKNIMYTNEQGTRLRLRRNVGGGSAGGRAAGSLPQLCAERLT